MAVILYWPDSGGCLRATAWPIVAHAALSAERPMMPRRMTMFAVLEVVSD